MAPESAGTQALSRGRVAIVTGAGRGIGRAMTLGLAQAGIRVVATSVREHAEIDAVAAEAARIWSSPFLPTAGRGMRYVSESFMTEPTRFREVEPETRRMVIDTNVNGPFLMARAATPHMARAGWGRIVNISMSRSTMRRAGFSPYGPSKAALESETALWAQDLAGTGVTVMPCCRAAPR